MRVLQEHFWLVPVAKRALTFVFLVRYVLGFKSQHQWKKFTVEDYKLNQRCFKRWGTHEAAIFNESPKYNALVDVIAPADSESSTAKKRKHVVESATASESPMKRVFTIDSDSTDSE